MSDPTDAMQADWQRTAMLVALEESMARGVRVTGGIRLGPPHPTPCAAMVKRVQSQSVAIGGRPPIRFQVRHRYRITASILAGRTDRQ
jgi:hypothetical protein